MNAERISVPRNTEHSVPASQRERKGTEDAIGRDGQQMSLAKATDLLDLLENLRGSGQISDEMYASESARVIAAALDHSEADIVAQLTYREYADPYYSGRRNSSNGTN